MMNLLLNFEAAESAQTTSVPAVVQERLVRRWWQRVTPEKHLSQSPQEQARTIPARYHGTGYHTNEPTMPLWREILAALRSPCPPALHDQRGTWCLEYAVIEDAGLAKRVAAVLLKHPGASIHHMRRSSGLSLPNS